MAERLTPEQLDDCATRIERWIADGEEVFDCPSFEELIGIMRQAARHARTLARVQAWTETPGDARVKSQVAALLRTEEEE